MTCGNFRRCSDATDSPFAWQIPALGLCKEIVKDSSDVLVLYVCPWVKQILTRCNKTKWMPLIMMRIMTSLSGYWGPLHRLCMGSWSKSRKMRVVLVLKFKIRSSHNLHIPRHTNIAIMSIHDDVIIWKHFPRYWPFVRGIHRSPVNSPHKGLWRGALVFSLICALNKRLSKQSWGWWFETPLRSLWRHCNVQAHKTYVIWIPRHKTWKPVHYALKPLTCGDRINSV